MSVRRALLARAVPFLAIPAIVLSAAPAYVHGIGDEAADKSVLEFVPIGIEHMLLGWDRLLFVAGVVLIAAGAKLAAQLISLFVLGNSTTLIAATLAGWRVNPEVVDVVIALSVVFLAGVGIFGRPSNFQWFGAAVLGFGLIHGLGLSTRFQDLGIPEEGALWRVIVFNVGIEIGQLTAIAALVGALFLAAKFIARDKQPRAAQLACAPTPSQTILMLHPDVLVDVPHDQRCGRSSSAAKKADALRTIALARRNSAFSLFSRFNSAVSSVLMPGRFPASTSACRCHFGTVSGVPTPSNSATRVIAAQSDS